MNSLLAQTLIRSLCLVTAVVSMASGPLASTASAAAAERNVYIARNLPDENLIVLSAALAAWRGDSVFLLDSSTATPHLKTFLAAYKPSRVVAIASDATAASDLQRRLELKEPVPLSWEKGPPLELWRSLFARAEDVVVCPAHPRSGLIQSACLAGVLRAPLFVVHSEAGERAKLGKLMAKWRTRRIFVIGKAEKAVPKLNGVERIPLSGESAVAALYQKILSRSHRIECAVVANPADEGEGLGCTSALAPWIAMQKHAALLLTNSQGTNVAEIVDRALRHEATRHLDTLILAANPRAIPVWRRPNPIPGDKDPHIEMEPLTPEGRRPFTFAIGRLFHEDRAVVPLLLARQRLLAQARGPRRALVASNPGGSLSLLETFSRNTIHELTNAGYRTTPLVGGKVSREELRKQLPLHDLFLWEGHHNTLIHEYEFPSWDEPLPPTFVFLQSCLALAEAKVHPLLSRGAVGVIGTSTRTYSASGGACSLAFFDALLYEQRSLGDSLRQAKNFLLAYSLLKEKRLGKGAMRTGANLRAAWAFSLWGDPTLKLPAPPRSASDPPSLPSIRHEVRGNTIAVYLPEKKAEPVRTAKYQTMLPANGRLAGLVRKHPVDELRALVPLVFAEIPLPHARLGLTPRLSSRLPSKRWVFCWDERRRCGYLLVTPRAMDTGELRFHVHWESLEVRNTSAKGKRGCLGTPSAASGVASAPREPNSGR